MREGIASIRLRQPRWRAGVLMIAACLLLGSAIWAAPSFAADGSIEIITNDDHPEFALDRSFLRSLFLMRIRQWPDGTLVRVFVLPDASEVHDQFCREILGTYPYVLRGAWDRIVYTGTGLGPTTVSSQEEMIARVKSTPGAIGYYRKRGDAAITIFQRRIATREGSQP